MRRAWLVGAILLSSTANAKIGPRDLSGYVGIDSVAVPPPSLPASFLTTPDITNTTFTVLANAATLMSNGDDFRYAFTMPANVRAYGSPLTTCGVHTNGLVTCDGTTTPFFDNRRLPDSRWGAAWVF